MRVVPDTNVLVAALISPDGTCGRLVLAAAEGRWTVVVSPQLLGELADVLARRKFRRWVSAEDARAFVGAVSRLAEVHDDPAHPEVITRDPDDDYLFALAVTAHADAVVSGDAHLGEVADPPVPVLSPTQLLARLEE